MRKFILGLTLLSMISVSCSRDDDNNRNAGDAISPTSVSKFVLPISKTLIKGDGEQVITTYSYDENKILEDVNNTTKEKTIFFYEGDKIVKLSSKDITIDFIYNENGTLKQKNTTYGQSEYKKEEVFTHINMTEITSVETDNYGRVINHIYTLHSNLDIAKIVSSNSDNSYVQFTTYAYDLYNGPRKNIKGIQKLMLPIFAQRPIKRMTVDTRTMEGGSSKQDVMAISYEYKYNEKKYPTEIYITTIENGEKTETKEIYKYNQ